MALPVVFYNADNGRPRPILNREIGAGLRKHKPIAFGLCETTGKRLRERDGYRLFHDTDGSPGRANVAVYVRDDVRVIAHWYVQMDRTFAKQPGKRGRHWARAFLVLLCELGDGRRVCFVIAHHPPGWKGTVRARVEHLRRLAEVMREQRAKGYAVILLWDANSAARALANRVGGNLVGSKATDTCIVIGGGGQHWYPKKFNKQDLASNHGHALVARLRLRQELPKASIEPVR